MRTDATDHIKPYVNKEISIKKQVVDAIEKDNLMKNKALQGDTVD